MMRILPVAIVAVLIGLAVILSLAVGADGEAQVQRPADTRYPEVWDALKKAHEVDIFVALTQLESPETQPLEAMKAHAAAVQDEVLGALIPNDVTLRRRFTISAALSLSITESGLRKLEDHPDVLGVELVLPGERLERLRN